MERRRAPAACGKRGIYVNPHVNPQATRSITRPHDTPRMRMSMGTRYLVEPRVESSMRPRATEGGEREAAGRAT